MGAGDAHLRAGGGSVRAGKEVRGVAEDGLSEGGGHGGDPFNAAVQPSLDFIIGRFRADGAS